MNKTLVASSLGALMAALTFSNAHADEERWPRWYVGISGGYTYMSDQDVSSASASSMQMNGGYGIGGSIGYLPSSSIPVINALRFEAEVTYHQNNVDRVNRTGGRPQIGGNDANYSSTAYMVNTFYDLQTGTKWTPYIGAGIGFASLHLPTSSNAGNTSSSDNEFAYQGMVGVGYSPDSIPNTQWSVGYRYLATSNPSFDNASTKYSTNNFEVGGKFKF